MDYLQLYQKYLGPGKRSGSWYSFVCPWCDTGTRGRHFRVNPITGGYCCMRCKNSPNGKGNAYMFARLMGDRLVIPKNSSPVFNETTYDMRLAIEVYTKIVDDYAYLIPGHKRALCARGIHNPEDPPNYLRSTNGLIARLKTAYPKDVLIASGLFYAKDTGDIKAYGVLSPGRVIIPYRLEDGVGYIRSRDMVYRAKNADAPPKYLSPCGAASRLWVWGSIDSSDQVIVTEGEFKAMVARQYGFPCVALPGMNSSHTMFVNSCAKKKVKEIVICFDTQLNRQDLVDAAAYSLAKELKAACPTSVIRKVTLPLCQEIDCGMKTDLDSFINARGPEAFSRLLSDHTQKRL